MKRFALALVLFFVVATDGRAQNISSVARGQAMEMVRALQKKDFTTFSKYMHPKMLEMAGGTDKLIRQMDTMNVMAKQFGAEIKAVHIGVPGKIVNYKKDMQMVIPETTELTSAFGNVELETSLVAISSDGGKNWKFIDTSMTNVKELKKTMPDLSPELVIPPMKQPKFTPKAAQ